MTRLWSYFRIGLDLLGGATLLSLAWFFLALWLEPESARRMAIPVSPVAAKLAGRIAPGLQAAARDYQSSFVAHAGGPIARYAAGMVYPVVVREIPRGTEIGCDRLLSHFGSVSLTDLVGMLVDHARAKGEAVNPSLHWYFQSHTAP